MSAYCERCGREFPLGDNVSCKVCHPPRRSIHEMLDEARIWLDYGDSYWRYPAWWALIILGAFCVVNGGIIFAMLIKWIWGF